MVDCRSNHIDYLAEAFLISKAGRYDIKGKICGSKFEILFFGCRA